MPSADKLQTLAKSLNRQLWAGSILGLVLIGGLGSWAALASLQSAVIAPGTVVVQTAKKKVQHQDGGIVAEIGVKDGDKVAAGSILFRLDGKQLEAELGVLQKRMFELTARRWRLAGERDGVNELGNPDDVSDLHKFVVDGTAMPILAVQRRLFGMKRDVLDSRKKQLGQRIEQLGQEVEGLERVKSAHEKQLEILQVEIADLADLRKKGLVQRPRVNALEREEAKLIGEIGKMQTEIARAKGKITETELQLLELGENHRTEALKELQSVEADLSQLAEHRRGLEDKLQRLDIRSPATGRVHEVAVHTVGGVIGAGEMLLYVVPDADDLVIDARVQLQQIDNVREGMPARIRFTAFNQRTTPELGAHVLWISPDQTTPEANQEPYFKVRLRLDKGEIERLQGLEIAAGMPAEVLITAQERTVASYLMKPLFDQFNRAFREE